MSDLREKLLNQCEVLRQNSLYTAESHHIISGDKQFWARAFQVAPAVLTAVLISTLVVGQPVDALVGRLLLATGVISAVGSVVDPKSEYYVHLNAAKLFTQLKNEAIALKDTFSFAINDGELTTAVEKLQSKYDMVVEATPATDSKAFEKARKRIKAGLHTPDKS